MDIRKQQILLKTKIKMENYVKYFKTNTVTQKRLTLNQ